MPTICAPCPGNKNAILFTLSPQFSGPCSVHTSDIPYVLEPQCYIAGKSKAVLAFLHHVLGESRFVRCFVCVLELPSNHLPPIWGQYYLNYSIMVKNHPTIYHS